MFPNAQSKSWWKLLKQEMFFTFYERKYSRGGGRLNKHWTILLHIFIPLLHIYLYIDVGVDRGIGSGVSAGLDGEVDM